DDGGDTILSPTNHLQAQRPRPTKRPRSRRVRFPSRCRRGKGRPSDATGRTAEVSRPDLASPRRRRKELSKTNAVSKVDYDLIGAAQVGRSQLKRAANSTKAARPGLRPVVTTATEEKAARTGDRTARSPRTARFAPRWQVRRRTRRLHKVRAARAGEGGTGVR